MRTNKKNSTFRKIDNRRAQGMTEYIIIVVLVAIAVLTGVQLFGKVVRNKFDESKATIDGELKLK